MFHKYLLPKLRTEPKKVAIDAAGSLVDIWYLVVWSPGESNEKNKKATPNIHVIFGFSDWRQSFLRNLSIDFFRSPTIWSLALFFASFSKIQILWGSRPASWMFVVLFDGLWPHFVLLFLKIIKILILFGRAKSAVELKVNSVF